MRKWQQRGLWAIASLALVLALGVYAVQSLTDSAQLQEIARDKVKQLWDRELTTGELKFKLFPYPQLHASKVTVSNPSWAREKHLLAATDIKASLAWLPLLSGQVAIKSLRFDGLQVNLEVAQDGRLSWDLSPKQKMNLSQTGLTLLRVKNSAITYRSRAGATSSWQVENLAVDGDAGLRNIAFDASIKRGSHALQLDGKLDQVSSFGTPGAVSKGAIHARSGQAAATISGQIPLDIALQNYDLVATLEAASLQEAFAFLGIERRSPAALKASVTLHSLDKKMAFENLKLQLGKLNLSGAGQLDRSGAKPVFDARLQADRIDMIQTFLDAGQPPLPPKKAGVLFRDKALAWPLLLALDGTQGTAEASIATLKLRSGIEVTDVASKISFNDDRMTVSAFSGKLLGGTVSGDALLEARKKAVHVKLNIADAALEQWLRQTGKNISVTGGPMKINANISTAGNSMNDFAAGLNGPVELQIGAAKILSPEAGRAESWMTGLFSAKDSDSINLSCFSARLPFHSGLAQGEAIAGVRSDASQLLARGEVNLRDQTMAMRGRVRARSGINLGASTFAGELNISGKLLKPEVSMDGSGAVGTLARIGAAILTSGASIVATSIWDGANPESDPCQVVFASKGKTAAAKPKRTSAD